MNWESAIVLFVTLIISLTVHEAAHALVAKWGGDRTAYYGGQVTLNPLPHIQREPFGMLVLPLIALGLTQGTMTFGFAHAPYDPIWAYHNPKKAAAMAAAGPLANVLLAAIAFGVLWFVGLPYQDNDSRVAPIAFHFLNINIMLAVFNAVPLPPLDGAGVVAGLVPPSRKLYDAWQRVPYSTIVVFVLMINFMGRLIQPVNETVMSWLR